MDDPAHTHDPAAGRLSRRRLLARAGAFAGAASAASLLSACGATTTTTVPPGTPEWWSRQRQTGRLVFANWPLYIDYSNWLKDRPSLNAFSRETGIEVTYEEVIENNEPFFQKIAPRLKAGRPLGYDLVVLTNGWQLSQLIENRWVIPLDHALIPNFAANAAQIAKSPAYDPGNRYTIPWQSGFTGIAYNRNAIRRDITSVKDLWDPAFRGRIGMMSDNTDLGSAGLLHLGIDPVHSTESDWKAAARVLAKQRPLVRDYYDQNYIDALERGDVWISQAWSGDIFQANASGNPEGLKFVVPREGALLWTDNMCIPEGALHPVDAIRLMDFVYRPDIAAMIAAYVAYVTPVPAARDQIVKMAQASGVPADQATSLQEIATSPLVFPSEQDEARLKRYRELKTDDELAQWQAAFGEFYL
ncbi:MAG: polyamine ABC transporter substrate-binding protein [Actinomycetota bacterium]